MMKVISIEEQKKIEIEILKDFCKFCHTNNLNYHLMYGTLLGAVRHKGFIPWDDDIDVSMPRRDYEKLLNIYNNNNSDKFKLIWYGNTEDYHLSFAKITDTRTIIKEKASMFSNIVQYGIYIDIFPLDMCSNCFIINKLIILFAKMLNRLVYLKIGKNQYQNSTLRKKIVYKLLIPILKKISLVTILRTKDKISRMYENRKYLNNIACLAGMSDGLEKIFNKSNFEGYDELFFENGMYHVPKQWDDVLTMIYGDYLTLPPVEERINRHTNICYFK